MTARFEIVPYADTQKYVCSTVILSDRRLDGGGSRRISSDSAETSFQKDVDLKTISALRQKDSSTLAIKIASLGMTYG